MLEPAIYNIYFKKDFLMNNKILEISSEVGNLLKEKNQTLGIVESSAGGMLSASILAIPGSSAFYLGGVVVYTKRSISGLMKITSADMLGIRSSTEECALLYARKIKNHLKCDWALSETGAAGPTGNSYGDRAGHTCIAVNGCTVSSKTIETNQSDRKENMYLFVENSLSFLYESLQACK
jgi:PncC family amidohydrolase